jgi:phosphoribosylaminoimidazole-succinocarboxamide synthase
MEIQRILGSMTNKIILKTEIPGLPAPRRGKVRDVYDLGDMLLVVATDRISCFDVVLGCAIPEKGRVLTQISLFWFDYLQPVMENHFFTADVSKYPAFLHKYRDQIAGRSMLVKKAKPLAIECIVRGYLSGSGWKEYQKSRSVCGIRLPLGLVESQKLPEEIFTPSTKADVGHDININAVAAEKIVGRDVLRVVREKSLALYTRAADYALTKGIIIADTKFEFGLFGDRIILIDEVLTPDSSRFWPLDGYVAGRAQPSYDKQFMRDHLESTGWDKTPPAPAVPEEIIQKTSAKYLHALEVLTS